MGRVSHTQTGLFGGVSQQTPGLRLGNQVAEMVNMFPSIAKGPTRRSPTVDISDLGTFAPDFRWSTDESNFKCRLHKIDGDESYLVFLTQVSGDPIRIWDLDGNELPVIFNGSTQTYCETNDTSASGGNLKAVTVLDTTYIVNTKVTPAVTSDLSKFGLDLTAAKYDWTASGSGTNEYYCVLSTGWQDDTDADGTPDGPVSVDPQISRPEEVLENDIQISEGTLGALAVGEWAYGDNDTLGYDTVYIRLTDEVDPDTKASEFVFAKPTSEVAFVIVDTGSDSHYSIGIDGAEFTRKGGSDPEDATSVMYDIVNTDIAGGAQATYPGPGTRGTTLRITKETAGANVPFQITLNDQPNIRLIKQKVDKFTDLPRRANDGDIIEITGEAAESEGSRYYVRFDETTNRWTETLPDGLSYKLDNTTMPVQMVRLQDDGIGTVTGTPNQLYFDVTEVTWGERLVGDNDSNPIPSFIGEPIQDVFFYQNRLGLLAGESVILSQTADYFNFFGQTTTEVLDDDPIDLTVAQNSAVRLQWAFPFSTSLELIGDRRQFSLHSGKNNPSLTPKNSVVDPTTSLEISSAVRPVRLDNKMFMLVEFPGDHVEVWRYTMTDGLGMAVEITKAVPNYIPTGFSGNPSVHQIEGCPEKQMVFLFTGGTDLVSGEYDLGEPPVTFETYVYNYFEQGNELAQSAWHKWSLRAAWGASFGSTLYAASNRGLVGASNDPDNYRYRLESMALEPAPHAGPLTFGDHLPDGYYLDGLKEPDALAKTGATLKATEGFPLVNSLLPTVALVVHDSRSLATPDQENIYTVAGNAGCPDAVNTEIDFPAIGSGVTTANHRIGFIYDSYIEPTESSLLKEGQGTQIGRLVHLSETVRVNLEDEVRIGVRGRKRRSMFNEDILTYLEDYTGTLLSQGLLDTNLDAAGSPVATPNYTLSDFDEGVLKIAFRASVDGNDQSWTLLGQGGGTEINITLDSSVAGTEVEDTVDVTVAGNGWSTSTAAADRPHVCLADGSLHLLELTHDGTDLTEVKLNGLVLAMTGTTTGDWFDQLALGLVNDGSFEVEGITLENDTNGASLRFSFNQDDGATTDVWYTDSSGVTSKFTCYCGDVASTVRYDSDLTTQWEPVEAFRYREYTTRAKRTNISDKYTPKVLCRAGVHLRAEDTVVRIASNDIWPLTISSVTWVANYIGNARGV